MYYALKFLDGIVFVAKLFLLSLKPFSSIYKFQDQDFVFLLYLFNLSVQRFVISGKPCVFFLFIVKPTPEMIHTLCVQFDLI